MGTSDLASIHAASLVEKKQKKLQSSEKKKRIKKIKKAKRKEKDEASRSASPDKNVQWTDGDEEDDPTGEEAPIAPTALFLEAEVPPAAEDGEKNTKEAEEQTVTENNDETNDGSTINNLHAKLFAEAFGEIPPEDLPDLKTVLHAEQSVSSICTAECNAAIPAFWRKLGKWFARE